MREFCLLEMLGTLIEDYTYDLLVCCSFVTAGVQVLSQRCLQHAINQNMCELYSLFTTICPAISNSVICAHCICL